jgi:ribokinase
MQSSPQDQHLPRLRLAVVGHLEWVTFLAVDQLPQAGLISRAHRSLEEPAAAGAVVAVQLAQLCGAEVLFFTALGRDAIGERSEARLRELGVTPQIAWRDQPTRRGLSLVDEKQQRHSPGEGED